MEPRFQTSFFRTGSEIVLVEFKKTDEKLEYDKMYDMWKRD